MASPGAAAAQGLESGFNLGLRMQGAQRDEEDRAERRKLQGEDRAWLRQERGAATSERERRMRLDEEDQALKALDVQMQTLRAEGDGYAQRYGGQVPADVAQSYQARVQELTGLRDGVLRRRYEPIVRQRQQLMTDVLGKFTTDPAALESVPDGDFYAALTTALRRDPRELLGSGDQPSRVDSAVTETIQGLQTGNEALMLRGVNVLLEPELKMGIGQDSPHGGKVVGKRVAAMAPHPEKPGEFTPVLRVYVSDGKIDTPDEEARAAQIRAEDPDAPPEATGYYMAPVTENRSTDPNDPVKSISVEKAMDYAARMQTLSQVLTRNPQLRAKIERAAAERGDQPDDFLAAHFALGGKMPEPKKAPKVSRERVDLGNTILERDLDESGNITAERRLAKGLPPRQAEGPTQGARDQTRQEREIERAVREGLITADEGRERKRQLVLGLKPADAAKAEKQSDKQRASQDAAIAQADRLIGKVDEATKLVSGWTTGIVGAVASKIPASERKDLEATLATIKANLGFAELQAMREASPTGGALGAIAVQELVALQSTVASLDESQKPETIKQNLAQIRQHYTAWRDAVMKAKAEDAGQPPPPAVGALVDGYRFKGGDPANPKSWEKARGGATGEF